MPDSTAVTVSDRVRVRSRPEVSDDSVMYTPLLPEGTEVFVLDGPVAGSGYEWYEVAPLSTPGFERLTGWVAAAGKDGEVWLVPRDTSCPAVPTDFAELGAVSVGQRLACLAGVPITVRARLVPCAGYEGSPDVAVTWQCDVDYAHFDPAWFGYPEPVPIVLADPADPAPISEFEDWHVLHLDPAATYPSALPVGDVVSVTGIFDHPAARGCRVSGIDQPWQPTDSCRLAFAVKAVGCVPTLLLPSAGTVLDNGRTDRSDGVTWDFAWTACPDAVAYQLYVIHAGSAHPVIATDLTVTSFRHTDPEAYVTDGNRLGWTWRVRALTNGQWGAWSEFGTFDVEPVNSD